jgi:cystathionine gamma-synthase
VQSGDHIVITDDSYKKTLEFCRSYLKQFAIECTIVPFGKYEQLERAIKKNTRFIFSESPTNPYLNVFDLVKIKKIAKARRLTLIDSTFSTPLNQRPIEFGMDLVLQKPHKYLAGHNDISRGPCWGKWAD